MINTSYYNISPVNFGNKNIKSLSPAVVGSAIQDSSKVMDYLGSVANINSAVIRNVKPYDVPIKDDLEFSRVMSRVKCAKTENGHPVWNEQLVVSHYPDANNIERGLLLYCGEGDLSYTINMFLSGRIKDPDIQRKWKGLLLSDKSMTNIVRVLDYSLNILDKEFGKYNGLVYRQGFMGENVGQFFSTSKSPGIAGSLHGNWLNFRPNAGYSVIRTKNAHNIYEFQKKMNSDFAKSEQEILISRKSRFKEIPHNELDEELALGRDLLAGKLFSFSDRIVNGTVSEYNGYTRDDLYGLIRVFDEV